MRLLAIETSSPVGSIALLDGAEVAERFVETPREQTELVLPLVDDLLSRGKLRLRDLDAVVFGRGPGSFTGLRVAAAVAQGLAVAAGLPIVGVSSLAGLAQRAWRELGLDDTIVCVDARMREVYFARYVMRNGRAVLCGHERLGPPAAVAAAEEMAIDAAGAAAAMDAADAVDAAMDAADTVDAVDAAGAAVAANQTRGWAAVGSGWHAYRDELAALSARASRVVPDLVPSARDLLVHAADDLAEGRILTPEQALPIYLRDDTAWRRTPAGSN